MSQLIQCARCGKLFDSSLRSCFHCGETKFRYVNCKKCQTAIPEFEAQYWQILDYPSDTTRKVPIALCKSCKHKAPEIISDLDVIFNSVKFTCQTCKHNFTKTAKFCSEDTRSNSRNVHARICLNPKLEDMIRSKSELEDMINLPRNYDVWKLTPVRSHRYPLRIQDTAQCPKCGGQSVSTLMDYPYVRCKFCGGLTERKNSFVKSTYLTRKRFNENTSWKNRKYYSIYIDGYLKVEPYFLDYYHKFCYDFSPEEPLVSFDEINFFISKYYSKKCLTENFYFAIRCILYYSLTGIILRNPIYLFLIGSALVFFDYSVFYKEQIDELKKYNKSIDIQEIYFIVSLYHPDEPISFPKV
ncbi:hypothetical protein PCC9214_02370 [Planktothrix tepida]|uniref:Uncharacterized protein n=2 Tax=Planktothrix TaxID=54304 RepID=A0A1J1LHC3_9CYAN|nr:MULTISPECIES: hypothetical protein [Planktothrix]CAD5948033.1 hypothetical protein PCC9214_02370 [Planktothrix tepida]CAD5962828.1 hypothetical protein NO713_03311 [Planktothrix pseudagardhii]CUR31888.1 hypothetical protein PL921430027 [Planktothrix tepida PCC 9214]